MNNKRLSIFNDEGFYDKRTGVQVRYVDTVGYQELVRKVFEYIKDGMRSEEIHATLLLDDPDLTDHKFETLIKHAYIYAENAIHKDREYTFKLHMERYEKMYREAMEMRDWDGRELDSKKDWHVIVGKFLSAMKALKMKEDLLGLHDKKFVLEFNDYKATVVEHVETRGKIPGYDIDKLSLDEKIELLQMIKDMRTVPLEGVHRVVVKKTVVEIGESGGYKIGKKDVSIEDVETIDVEFEDMPEKVVDKFEGIEDKKKEEPEQEFELGVNIEDDRTAEQKKPKREIKSSHSDKLLEEFKKKLKNKP